MQNISIFSENGANFREQLRKFNVTPITTTE